MEVFAGILFVVAALFNFLGLAIDSELAITVHIIKFIIGVAAIVILFNIGAPMWMYAVSILSVVFGLIGGCLAVNESFAAFPMIIGGIAGSLAVGLSLFF